MPLPPVIIVQLVHISGPMKGEIQEFAEGMITIGRRPSSHVKFPADFTSISRDHAEIVREGNKFRLVDHSSNGTFVNGKKVQEAYLRDGDVVMFAEGGPKISFLTQTKEGVASIETVAPPRPKEFREEPKTPIPPKPSPVPEERIKPEPSFYSEVAQPKVEKSKPVTVQKTNVPLVIQYGPAIRSYKAVPVTIGKHPKCDFALQHPALYDQHIQIFFSENQYWVKDLTGKALVQLNNRPIGFDAPLNVNDDIALSPQGPVFRFLGEGRLAEVAEPVFEQPATPSRETEAASRDFPQDKEPSGLFAKLKKSLKK
ncbi:MAG: FHA domain-containing protein [Syntrophaceae bacterium]